MTSMNLGSLIILGSLSLNHIRGEKGPVSENIYFICSWDNNGNAKCKAM